MANRLLRLCRLRVVLGSSDTCRQPACITGHRAGAGGADRYAGMVLYANDGLAPLLDLSTGGDPASGSAGADAAALTLLAPDGTLLGRLGTSGPAGVPSRAASLVLNDRAGHPRLLLAVEDDGTPSIKLLATDGSVLWRTPEEPRK